MRWVWYRSKVRTTFQLPEVSDFTYSQKHFTQSVKFNLSTETLFSRTKRSALYGIKSKTDSCSQRLSLSMTGYSIVFPFQDKKSIKCRLICAYDGHNFDTVHILEIVDKYLDFSSAPASEYQFLTKTLRRVSVCRYSRLI